MSGLKQGIESKNRQILVSRAFCFSKALKGLDDAHQYWEGKFPLLSPPIQMLSHVKTQSHTHPEVIFNLVLTSNQVAT